LDAGHDSAAEIRRQLVDVYGKEVMSCQSMAKWRSDFKSGRAGTMDNGGSGRHNISYSPPGGQSWNIRRTAKISRRVIFTSFALLRIIFLATDLQMTT
jgi:hypothetical protein